MGLIIKKRVLDESSLKEEISKSNDEGIQYSLDISKKSGDIQEVYGRLSLLRNDFQDLIHVSGNVHGFDGLFIKDQKVFFYESKLKVSSFGACLNDAEDTINNYKHKRQMSTVRFSQLMGAKKILKFTKSTSEIEMIDGYLLKQKSKVSLAIPNKRQVLILGSNKKISRISPKTTDKLLKKERVELIQYEEI